MRATGRCPFACPRKPQGRGITKREALDHTKLKRLCRRLQIPRYQAVGILEVLWHITAKEAPRGDIGKLSNEDIAVGIEYEQDEDKLIDALVQSGWLDASEEHRLTVHDWSEHADDAVHMRLARARLKFVCGSTPRTSRLPSWERTQADEFYGVVRTDRKNVRTEPQSVSTACGSQSQSQSQSPARARASSVLHTHTEPTPVRAPRGPVAADLNGHTSPRFEEFWNAYPRQQRKDFACREWCSVVSVEVEEQVFACLKNYLASDEVNRGVVMNPDKWLYEQHRNGWGGRWPARAQPQSAVRISPTQQAIAEAKARRQK